VRRALGALLLALGRDPGVTLIETDRWTLAEELWSFGEDSLYPVALQLSDEDMVRLWLLSGGLLLKERARSSGEATALAAVAVIEGNQRPLARKRRRPQANRLRFDGRRKNGTPKSPGSRTARPSMKSGVEAPRTILPVASSASTRSSILGVDHQERPLRRLRDRRGPRPPRRRRQTERDVVRRGERGFDRAVERLRR
jgi:hypothetical protein